MERLFQSYQREENIKLREKAKRNKAQRQQQTKSTDDGSPSNLLKSRDEDVTDQSLEKALSKGLKRFKAGDGYRTAATALEGVSLLIRILNDVKDHPDQEAAHLQGVESVFERREFERWKPCSKIAWC